MNTEAGMERLGRSIRLMRELTGLTQDQIAERGGPSDVTIRGLENGAGKKPNAATLRKLDKGLGWHEGTAAKIMRGEAEVLKEFDDESQEIYPWVLDYTNVPPPPSDEALEDMTASWQADRPIYEQSTPDLLTELTGRFRAQELRIASLEEERDELRKRLTRLQGAAPAAGGSGVEDPAERHGVTPLRGRRPAADDGDDDAAEIPRAAHKGVSQRVRMDADAARRGEESQDPEDWQ